MNRPTPDKEMRNGNGTAHSEDPDPTENFPQWSKTLLVLLDYAMIEGVRHRLNMFVHLLDMARLELHSQAAAASDPVAHTGKNTRGKKGRARS